MLPIDWNDNACGVAGYMQQFRALLARGAVRVQYEMLHAPTDQAYPVVVSVFGNDNDADGKREVQLLRKRLQDSALEELGYGESADGASWAMLVGSTAHSCETASGKQFQEEMMQMFLDDLVWRAWEKVREGK